ncbi:hypothetical protein B9G54_01670 [Alloscardovia macacae]|uniref:PD-(D/E)XK endonuclease-like domain-containing protein n=1 Tax=Alloscardovia macacae TaxID=1160091 RepID=A0A1Y2SY26_9BIFI|nr:hypothetical protein [Alloscardovia macacae]OTA27254.1 hypothetical protein B9G54_01670 [Alloscardovia macacae]OTA29264.1 hypothetical protein B9T39_03865 [Alloscardovia macacae]
MSELADILAVAGTLEQEESHSPAPASAASGESELWGGIRAIIENDIVDAPRNQQKRIGPSELGTQCVHCLAAKLVEWEQVKAPAWLPFIGTCVHEHFEHLFPRVYGEDGNTPYRSERRVTVGQLQRVSGGYEVRGSIDLVDLEHHATIDWKIVGATTLKQVRANGPSQQYRVQASLYGLGLEGEGERVEKSCIFFLPRTSQSLADAYIWESQFDPEPGRWAMRRAQNLMNVLDNIELNYGISVRDEFIRRLPRAEHCWDCGTWTQESSTSHYLSGTDSSSTSSLPADVADWLTRFPATYVPKN